MPQYACMVQEGQLADRTRDRLADGLKRLGAEAFGDVPAEVEIRWVAIRKGFGFTAGKPSTSSLIARSVPAELGDDARTQEQKDRLVAGLADALARAFDLRPEQVSVVTVDVPARWVMEGGDLLPEPGDEASWLARHGA